jgi:hypothetical protein
VEYLLTIIPNINDEDLRFSGKVDTNQSNSKQETADSIRSAIKSCLNFGSIKKQQGSPLDLAFGHFGSRKQGSG